MNTCNEDSTSTVAIISGVLLVASEILPYIKTTEGNGIIHGIVNVLKRITIKPVPQTVDDTREI